MSKASGPIWKILIPLTMLVIALFIIGGAADYDRPTVLLTASWGAYLLALVAGAIAAIAALWMARADGRPESEASEGDDLKAGCAAMVFVILCGWAASLMTGQWIEARAFAGKQPPVTEATYPIVGANMGEQRRHRLFYRRPDHPTLTIRSDDGAIDGIIPVPAALVTEAGNVRNDTLLNQKCLTLQIQQSGDTIRAVVRGSDGGMLKMRVHACNPGPPPHATAPS